MERPAKTAPDWLVREMPSGYQNRVEEIERLTRDLESMGRFGRLLWETGFDLHDVVLDAFGVFKLDAAVLPNAPDGWLSVNLDANRRLLVYISSAAGTIEKKSADLAHVFRGLQELAGDGDRVVLVANVDAAKPPADRSLPISAEALEFLTRMGGNFLPTSTLFALWRRSFEDDGRARQYLERLHAQDGGAAPLPPSGT